MLTRVQIVRRLKLRDLHMLQAIAQHGSMARAAGHLGMSQPAISKAVAELEHLLGAKLLDRTPRGVEFTAYGGILARRAAVVFDELTQGLQEIAFLSDPTTGDIRVGCTAPMTVVVAAVIQQMAQAYPGVTFHVAVLDTNILLRQIRDRSLDIAITRMPSDDPDDDIRAELLFHDPLIVITSRRNPLLRRHGLRLADLLAEPWIMPPPDGFLMPFIAEAFRAEGLEVPAARVVSVSSDLRISLLAAGPFLTILPDAFLRFPGISSILRALPVPLAGTRRPILAIALKHRTISPVAELFIRIAKQEVRHLVPADGQTLGSEAVDSISASAERKEDARPGLGAGDFKRKP